MLAVEVADPLMVALISSSFVMVVGMMAWMVRSLLKLEGRIEAAEKLAEWRYDVHTERLRDLEQSAATQHRHET